MQKKLRKLFRNLVKPINIFRVVLVISLGLAGSVFLFPSQTHKAEAIDQFFEKKSEAQLYLEEHPIAIEVLGERSLNAKVFNNNDGTFTMHSHIGHIHYKDKNDKQFKDIDTTLIPTDYGWEMRKASYEVEIPQYADNWFKFINSFILDPRTNEEHDLPGETVNVKPIGVSHSKGQLITDPDEHWQNKKVVYKNVFGTDIDLVIQARNIGFDKLIVLNNKPTDLSEDLEFQFEIDIPDNFKFKPEIHSIPANLQVLIESKKNQIKSYENKAKSLEKQGKYAEAEQKTALYKQKLGELEDELVRITWNKADIFETSKSIILGDLKKTWFKDFKIWDSDGERANIRVKLEKVGDKIIFTKIIPKEFLEIATYPVYTDTTESYYAGAGDGHVYNQNSSGWSGTRNDLSGDYADYTGSTANINSTTPYYYNIFRGFFPINTSGLPDSASISTATVNFYVTTKENTDADGNDYIVIIQTTQASTSELIVEDYDQIGSVAGSSNVDIDTISTSAYNAWTLNATGRGWISKTGWTKIGAREGHDMVNDPISTGTDCSITVSTSEQADTTYDPYLEVTYTVVPDPPDTLYVGYPSAQSGSANPTNFAYSTPFFSAINRHDLAVTTVQIQLTLSTDTGYASSIWDSGDITISSTADDARTPDIFYGSGNAPSGILAAGENYIWRIKTKDGTYSDWSSNGTIGMSGGSLTGRFYTGAGDGSVIRSGQATWSDAQDTLAGQGASYTGTGTSVRSQKDPGGYYIYRGFLPIDTSGLGAGATISAAVLKVYVSLLADDVNDGNDFIRVVQTNQVSTSALEVGDYDECGDAIDNPTAGATDVDLGTMSASAYNNFTLNATGIGWIALTGWTKLGLREGHDATDTTIGAASANNSMAIRLSEYADITYDPYLEVTYTVNTTPNATSVSDAPDPVNVGSDVTFTGGWTESDSGDLVKMYVCKDSTCTNCNNTAQTNCWCYSSAFQTEPDVSDTCNYTAQSGDMGDNSYWLGVCDDEPSCDSSPFSGGTFTVGTRPTAASASIDSGAVSVTLTEATTTNVVCAATVTDNDGFADITSVEAKFYRTGVGAGAGDDNANHYTLSGDANCVPSGGAGNTENYTCTFAVQFYADPTDVGSAYEADDWTCQVTPSDGIGAGTADTDTIEMDTTTALDVTTTITYGALALGANTTTTDQTTTVTNTGNEQIDVQLDGYGASDGDGKAMTCTIGTIAIGQERYSLTAATDWTNKTQLTDTAATLTAFDLAKGASSTKAVYWGFGMPSTGVGGFCTGKVNFTAVSG